MKWIKYNVFQNRINVGTETSPVYEDILLEKEIVYCEENLAIAQEEAYKGIYTIEEDDDVPEKEPIKIENGGTGANSAKDALINLGIEPRLKNTQWQTLGSVSYSGSHTQTTASSNYEVSKKEVVNIPCDPDILKEFALFRYVIKAGSSFSVQGTSTTRGSQESGVIIKSDACGMIFASGCQFTIPSSAANGSTLSDEYSYTVPEDLIVHTLGIGTDAICEIKNYTYKINVSPSSNSPTTLASLKVVLGDFDEDSQYGFWGTTSAQCAFTIELQGKR